MKKIAIIGCGFLGNIIADAMKKGLLTDYTLAGAMSHQKASAEKLCAGLGGEAVESLDELLALKPDMVIETASVAMVREACIPTLEHGAGCRCVRHAHVQPPVPSDRTRHPQMHRWKAG